MDISYVVTPLAAWLIAGSAKFAINSLKAKSAAFKQIGYGGFPSNHTSIVTSVAWLIALKEGLAEPALGVAVALAFIVILDATSLRMKVGEQARRLNRLTPDQTPLRERMGHTPFEVLGGVVTGLGTAVLMHYLVRWFSFT